MGTGQGPGSKEPFTRMPLTEGHNSNRLTPFVCPRNRTADRLGVTTISSGSSRWHARCVDRNPSAVGHRAPRLRGHPGTGQRETQTADLAELQSRRPPWPHRATTSTTTAIRHLSSADAGCVATTRARASGCGSGSEPEAGLAAELTPPECLGRGQWRITVVVCDGAVMLRSGT